MNVITGVKRKRSDQTWTHRRTNPKQSGADLTVHPRGCVFTPL